MSGSASVGAPVAIGLLALAEAAVPIGVPADVLMLIVGERAAAGAVSPWVAVAGLEAALVVGTTASSLAVRGPMRALLAGIGPCVGLTGARLGRAPALVERRGSRGIALGRATPGLRTLTVVATSSAGLPPRRALLPLLAGSTLFVHAHFVLGYAFGPAVLDVLGRVHPVVLAVGMVMTAAALVVWVRWRGRAGAQAWAEAGCPACTLLGPLGDRLLAGRPPCPAPP